MDITGIISAIVVGLIIGALGRLAVPGKQKIGWIMTFVVGLAGAFIGGYLASTFTSVWLVILVLQVAVAAVLVVLISGRTAVKSSLPR